jgi:hypothetical protein
MKYAVSKEQFIELMEFEGYGVKWTDTRKNITYTTPKGMKCRDDRLHESKYLKERMELELRIRQEIIAGGTQTAEQTTVTPKADAHSFSSDTGEVGQSVLQPKLHLGWDRGFAEPDESLAATNQQHQNADEQPAHEDGTGAIEQEFVQDTADLITGWEQERVFLFSAQAEIAEVGMDIGNDLGGVGIANLGSDFVKLGKSLEQANQHVPVRDSTTQKVVHERKKGVGQKQDDHSGYDFEMKM